MIKLPYILLPLLTIFLLTACGKPDHHPKNPNYSIKKPKIIHAPNKQNLGKMVKKLQGSPYVWAEEGPDHFDCSGYTYYMYGSMGIEIPRVARAQAKVGQYIKPTELQYGDLIFFDTTKKQNGKITHVGMYLGDGWFTHASTTKYEVVYSNLHTSKYFKKRLRICRRYLPDQKVKTHVAAAAPWKTQPLLPAISNTPAKTQTAIAVSEPSTQRPLIDSTASGTYYVQVGSFTGKPKTTLLYDITRQGYKYKIIQFPKGKTHISKLLIGPYKDRVSALEILPKVKSNIEKAAFIAEIL